MKNKKNKDYKAYLVLLAVVIFVLMLASAYSYFSNRYNYKGKAGEFQIDKQVVQGIDVYNLHVFSNEIEYVYHFRNHPSDLEDIPIEEDLVKYLNRPNGTRTLYVTSKPDLGNMTSSKDVIAAVGFEQVLSGAAGLYGMNLINTYTAKFKRDLPAIQCNDVNNETAVIIMQLAGETQVYSNKNRECIIIQGTDGDSLIKAGEKFGYYLLGVF